MAVTEPVSFKERAKVMRPGGSMSEAGNQYKNYIERQARGGGGFLSAMSADSNQVD